MASEKHAVQTDCVAVRAIEGFMARQPQPLRATLAFALFAGSYYVAYRFGMAFSHASASPFWFPDSVLLCGLLVWRPHTWWILILATLPIRLFSEVAEGIPLDFLAACFANDSAKGVLTAVALRVFLDNPLRLTSARDFAVYCGFAVLLVPAASAFAGAATRASIGHDYWLAWEQWFFGDALSHLVITPFVLYWVVGTPWRAPSPNVKRILEAGALANGLIFTCVLACTADSTSTYFADARYYATIPFLFWAALRFGMLGASGAIAVVAAIMVEAALNGHGPFAGRTPDDTAFALQNYLFLRAAPLLLIAAAVERNKTVEGALRESEMRFGDLADTTPVLVWMTDVKGGVTFVNKAYAAFLGRDLAQEAGDGWLETIHPDDRDACFRGWSNVVAAQAPYDAEFRVRRRDGEWRWMHSRASPRYAADGAFMGYVGSAVDVSDRKRVEGISHSMAHVQRLAAMGELTAALAHEVKQPLAAMLTNTNAAMHLLEGGARHAQEIREALNDIRSDNMHASEVIDRIRQFMRKTDAAYAPVDINAVVADALKLVAADVRRRDIRMQTEFEAGIPSVNGDRTQLQQVLLNLVINAMEAMEDMPVARRLVVRTRVRGDSVEISVIDSGAGIAPERLAFLFDPFLTTKDGGMGLGLSVARAIVDDHHGRIEAENNPDGGATFRFTLPTLLSR